MQPRWTYRPLVRTRTVFCAVDQQELADAVQESLQSLPENLREAMIDAFWYDKPVDAKLRTAALKALRTPTVRQTLRTYV